jgi:hypothetical protein
MVETTIRKYLVPASETKVSCRLSRSELRVRRQVEGPAWFDRLLQP